MVTKVVCDVDKYIGKVLDNRYQIQQLIGIGGMANVYKAYDSVDERYVAIKILKDEYVDNQDFLRRFKNECKAIAALTHANIVTIFDMSFDDKFYWIVMEFIDGITLKEYIEQQGILNYKEAVYFIMQILLALQHAHNKGIIHRDIKPQNIMLLRDGTIKVMDFGIARFARNETKTLTDKAIGSVHYISPEQAKGEFIDQTTDIYSVGVMLFEMLTGSLPFEADSAVSVAIKQIEVDPIRPRQINSQIPKAVEQIIIKAMMKNKQDRYQSATQMLKDLISFKNNPSVVLNYQQSKNKININDKMDDDDLKNGERSNNNRCVKKHPNEAGNKGGAKPKSTTAIQSLTGIAAALVVASVIFVVVAYLVYNPFAPSKEVQIPDLVGKVYQEVKKEDAYKSFDIQQETTSYSEEYDEGYIFEQSPNPGRIVKNKAIIKVKVSKGRKLVTIPNFANKDFSSVSVEIQKLGLKVSVVKMHDPKVTENFVIKTNPAEDSEVPVGTTVRVYVSTGVEQKLVMVPSLINLNFNDATKVLEEQGLKIGEISNVDADVPEGIIVAQDPEENSQVPVNSFININKSTGNKPLKKLVLPIKLPYITEVVKVQALLDGREVKSEVIEPAEVDVWRVELEGEGTAKVKIIVDRKVYAEIEVDFEKSGYKEIKNNSTQFPQR